MASTYLTRTPSSNGNRKTFTYSAWIKIGSTATMQLFSAGDSTYYTSLRVTQTGLRATNYDTSTAWNLRTNRLFRDTNAWYHIVLRVDTTQSTASDRIRIYVNGELQTSLLENTYPSQNIDDHVNSTELHAIGTTIPVGSNNFDGSMSHIHLCDGYSYDASAFGSTDSTTGEWKINTSPSVTYGTNGFFILKDGNSVTDQSGNSNNWSVGGGTLTKTEDNPSNVFATFNVLNNDQGNSFSYGNNKVDIPQAKYFGAASTLGMYSGKYYCEIKLTGGATDGSGNYKSFIGISGNPSEQNRNNRYYGQDSYSYGYQGESGSVDNGASATSYGNTYTNGDIIGIALDLDNNKLYFSKNGTWQNSGVPTSGSTGTGAVSIGTSPTGFWFFGCSSSSTNYATNHSANFGNGYFQQTAVSSAGTNASGNGIFEYDVPTGYTALSTKGLNL